MTRYAIYFAPAAGSPWWEAGCRWLGRDAESGVPVAQPPIPGIAQPTLEKLTADVRRYGWHATLKAPFRLAEGFDESHLMAMAQAFAAVQCPVPLPDLQVQPIGAFLALRPSGNTDDIAALAQRCVQYFDSLRAAPDAAELGRRRGSGPSSRLSTRQEALLQRWGYPYTEEEFRFHLTLSDSLTGLDAAIVDTLRRAAEEHFAAVPAAAPLVLDGITLFREEQAGAPFSVWRRLPFGVHCARPALPQPGRLYYFVGPSGVGKDALLRWVERRLAHHSRIVFARRTITRPAHASEAHEATDTTQFWARAAAGHFSMIWQANALCYGIPRGIEADLKAGRDVIVNGSREYVPQLRQMFPDARVILVEADAALIEARIEARQRETGPALLARMERHGRFPLQDVPGVVRLDNSGPLELAGQRLLDLLASPVQS